MNPLITGNLKSKTSWTAILLVVLGTLNDQADMLKELLPGPYVGKVIIGVGLLFLILRNITSDSITEKGSPDTLPPPSKSTTEPSK